MIPMCVGAITVEDMKVALEDLKRRGATDEEIEERISALEDRNNKFLAAVFGIGFPPGAEC